MAPSRTHRTVAAVALAAPFALFPLSAAQAAEDAQVSVFHGIPDLPVDVYVNGDLTLEDFKPGDVAGPLALPADTYSIEITDPDDKKTVLLGPADVTVEAGGNYTIVANLDAKGDPTVTPFENDISAVAAGEARVTVRHVAAAPEVDIEANGDVLAPGLVNGDEAVADVPADSYDVAVVPAGGGAAVWNEDVDLAEGVNTIAYAWGSLDDDSFAVAVQTIDGLHSAPGSVNAGEVGLAAETSGSNPALLGALVVSFLVAAAAAVRLVLVRR
ncbi:MAG: DUF4397 domain-containing protein [Actinomycetia bacterium]|nr:DUF4397 domain-containing protein [Actinomycetes bacterium]